MPHGVASHQVFPSGAVGGSIPQKDKASLVFGSSENSQSTATGPSSLPKTGHPSSRAASPSNRPPSGSSAPSGSSGPSGSHHSGAPSGSHHSGAPSGSYHSGAPSGSYGTSGSYGGGGGSASAYSRVPAVYAVPVPAAEPYPNEDSVSRSFKNAGIPKTSLVTGAASFLVNLTLIFLICGIECPLDQNNAGHFLAFLVVADLALVFMLVVEIMKSACFHTMISKTMSFLIVGSVALLIYGLVGMLANGLCNKKGEKGMTGGMNIGIWLMTAISVLCHTVCHYHYPYCYFA